MKETTLGGISLILIGIIIFAAWIGIYGFCLHQRWAATKYGQDGIGAFIEHFFALGKMHLALACVVGGIPFFTGVYLLFKK